MPGSTGRPTACKALERVRGGGGDHMAVGRKLHKRPLLDLALYLEPT